jgi:hypothetical protein
MAPAAPHKPERLAMEEVRRGLVYYDVPAKRGAGAGDGAGEGRGMNEVQELVVGALQGIGASTVFVLVLFIGFCVVFGFTKLKKTSGRSPVVKSLEEALTHQTVRYLLPTDPRGPADQLRSPELVEAAASRRA